MHRFFRGDFFNFEAIRILGTAGYGGADVAEFLEAIEKVREDDSESWHKAWAEQGQKAQAIAQDALRHGHTRAARSAFIRASNYTRASAYMMTGANIGESDPRVAPILRESVKLFRMAARLFDGQVLELQVPYQDGVSLPAYLHLPPPSSQLPGKTPILVNFIGADSVQEEIYYMFPAAGPDLGYAVVTVEGPGQGLTLHERGIPMRPDWEAVSDAVLDRITDFAHEHPELELDINRLAIGGASLGGYFALRAAADARYKACVAIDPLCDLYEFATSHVAPTFFRLWDIGVIPDWVVDAIVSMGMRFSFQMRWEINTSCRFLGASSAADLLRSMKLFTLQGRVTGPGRKNEVEDKFLHRLTCPVLVSGAAESLYFDVDAHTMRVFNSLSHSPNKEVWVGTAPSDGSLQAKMGAMALCNQRTFEFLDRQFGIQRSAHVQQ